MRFPKMKPGDLVVVKLYDLTSNSNWLSDYQAQNFPAMSCVLCGWFINKDKEVIRISNLIAEDGDKAVIVIPRGFLRSIKVIPYDRG